MRRKESCRKRGGCGTYSHATRPIKSSGAVKCCKKYLAGRNAEIDIYPDIRDKKALKPFPTNSLDVYLKGMLLLGTKERGKMDKIILSILILKRLTAYEIRNIIRQNYSSMCSDSLGSIQVALKKLFAAGFVTCTEFVENSVNKKQYSITELGRQDFMGWLKTPMDMSKTKNMDLGKLLLMGLVPASERVALLDEILSQHNKELEELLEIQKRVEQSDGKQQLLDYMKKDTEYLLGIQHASGQADIAESLNEISYFQNMTLQFGIDSAKFHLEWFKKLRCNILKRGV